MTANAMAPRTLFAPLNVLDGAVNEGGHHNRLLAEINPDPKPFVWTAHPHPPSNRGKQAVRPGRHVNG